MSALELRQLEDGDFDAVHAAFVDAFSDYVVKLSPSREQLREMLTRRGWSPAHSVAAFEDGRIVAFTLNGIDGATGYDSGTGVVPSHRRRGLAEETMKQSFALLRDAGAKRYVLEVIESNSGAADLYRKLGFEETRRLQCWMRETGAADALPRVPAERTAERLMQLIQFCDVEPSWQNSVASILRAKDSFELIGDERGFAVVFPSNGDVPLLAVRDNERRKGFGTQLLDAAQAIAAKPLRIINVDVRDAGIERFLEARGARRTVRQIEMCAAL